MTVRIDSAGRAHHASASGLAAALRATCRTRAVSRSQQASDCAAWEADVGDDCKVTASLLGRLALGSRPSSLGSVILSSLLAAVVPCCRCLCLVLLLSARDLNGAGELVCRQPAPVPSDHEANARAPWVERPCHPLLQLVYSGLSQQQAGMPQDGQHVGSAGRQQVHVTHVARSQTQVRVALSSGHSTGGARVLRGGRRERGRGAAGLQAWLTSCWPWMMRPSLSPSLRRLDSSRRVLWLPRAAAAAARRTEGGQCCGSGCGSGWPAVLCSSASDPCPR